MFKTKTCYYYSFNFYCEVWNVSAKLGYIKTKLFNIKLKWEFDTYIISLRTLYIL